ncbi:hypothetical protein BV22DRAFT_1035515 [Leucogyrophana mollusca]|uniref:Uncharacterized protein n=1 Tax=Leucogyrophana mollusca TaxID=85980 RepID=A0ACB8BHU8_9AGAM|nr:hypothetical protein BV22DRAFT_1035515 [Leucogyrophana mollusca]
MAWYPPIPRQASSTGGTSGPSLSASEPPASASAPAAPSNPGATTQDSATSIPSTAVGSSAVGSSAGASSSADGSSSTSVAVAPSTSAIASQSSTSSPSASSADSTSTPGTSTSYAQETSSVLTTQSSSSPSTTSSTDGSTSSTNSLSQSPSASSSTASSSSPSTSPASSSPSSSSRSHSPSSSASSSVSSESWTTYTSSYVTVVSGSMTVTTTTAIPTLSTNPPRDTTSSNRTAIIAGSTAGAAVLILAVLSIAFYRTRKRFKYLGFLDSIASRRKQQQARANLLAGEDLDDHDLSRPARYRDYETPWDDDAQSPHSWVAGRESPMLHRARGSESGSVFREDVWPPPSEGSRLVDPLLAASGSIDLSRIVDDVMGPPAAAGHFSQNSVSSSRKDLSGSGYESDRERVGSHSRAWSSGSQTALLEAAGLLGPNARQTGEASPPKPGPHTSPLKNNISANTS